MTADFFPVEQQNLMDHAQAWYPPEPVGAFHNFWGGAVQSAELGFAKAARGISMLGSAFPVIADKYQSVLTGEDVTDRGDAYYRAHEDLFKPAVEYWTPKPNEVGVAGQMVGGLISGLAELTISPVMMVGATAAAEMEDLTNAGVGTEKAIQGGIIQGAGLAAGIALPFLGKTLASKMLTGAAGNVVQGVATRGLEAGILEGTPMEGQYQTYDQTSMLFDVLMGLGFGGIDYIKSSGLDPAKAKFIQDSMTETQKSSILVANLARHMEDSAPGIAHDAESLNAHDAALKQAIKDIAEGKPTDASVDATKFTVDPVKQAETEKLATEVVDSVQAKITEIPDSSFESVIIPKILAETSSIADAGVIKNLDAELKQLEHQLDLVDDQFKPLAKKYQNEGMSRKEAESAARKQLDDLKEDIQGKIDNLTTQKENHRIGAEAAKDLAMVKNGDLTDAEKQYLADKYGVKIEKRIAPETLDVEGQNWNLFTRIRDQFRATQVLSDEQADQVSIAEFARYANLGRELGITPDQAYVRYAPVIEGPVAMVKDLPPEQTVAMAEKFAAENPDEIIRFKGEKMKVSEFVDRMKEDVRMADEDAKLFQTVADCLGA